MKVVNGMMSMFSNRTYRIQIIITIDKLHDFIVGSTHYRINTFIIYHHSLIIIIIIHFPYPYYHN